MKADPTSGLEWPLLAHLAPLSISIARICLFVGEGKMEIFKRPREQKAALEIALSPQEGSVTGGEIMGFIHCIVRVINSKPGGQRGCSVWVNWCPAYFQEENKSSTTSKSPPEEKKCSLKMPLPGTLAARQ